MCAVGLINSGCCWVGRTGEPSRPAGGTVLLRPCSMWPLSSLLCDVLVPFSRSSSRLRPQGPCSVRRLAASLCTSVSKMGFAGSFVDSEPLGKSWKLLSVLLPWRPIAFVPSPPPSPAVHMSVSNALIAAWSARAVFVSFASSWSAENSSAKCTFKKGMFIIFPELYIHGQMEKRNRNIQKKPDR